MLAHFYEKKKSEFVLIPDGSICLQLLRGPRTGCCSTYGNRKQDFDNYINSLKKWNLYFAGISEGNKHLFVELLLVHRSRKKNVRILECWDCLYDKNGTCVDYDGNLSEFIADCDRLGLYKLKGLHKPVHTHVRMYYPNSHREIF